MDNWVWKKYYQNGWPVLLVFVIIALLLWLLETFFNIKIIQ